VVSTEQVVRIGYGDAGASLTTLGQNIARSRPHRRLRERRRHNRRVGPAIALLEGERSVGPSTQFGRRRGGRAEEGEAWRRARLEPLHLATCNGNSPTARRDAAIRPRGSPARSATFSFPAYPASGNHAGAARGARSAPSARPKARRTDVVVDLSVDVQPRRILALEQELLNAPVQKLGDKQHVGRRAGHLVNPAELLQSFAGSAEHSQ
jgi:hypothetical protein